MSRLTRSFMNVGIALAIVLALVASAWGALPAAAQQSPDAANFTATVSSAGGPEQAMLQAEAPAPALVGDEVTFTLRADGAQGLAGYQFALQYDEQALDFKTIEVAPEWKAAGFQVVQLGPVRGDGVVHFGAVVCPVGECVGVNYNQPKQDLSNLPANAVLAKATFVVRAAGAYTFNVRESRLADQAGQALGVTQAAADQALDDKAFDFSDNGVVNRGDADLVIGVWEELLERGKCISPAAERYDVDGSGCVDAADVQMILAHWGADFRPAQALTIDAPSATNQTFTVNSNGNGPDANPGNGVCETANGNGVCTLRAAIQETNYLGGRDTINFNITGANSCPATIVSSTTMVVDDSNNFGTVIDGYTQCDAQANTGARAGNARIRINLQGTLAENEYGIHLNSPNNVVQGLAIYDFDQQIAIRGSSADHNEVQGNFIGTDAAANHNTEFSAVESNGIDIRVGANNNTIGGTAPADRNLISGNDQDGLNIQGPDVHSNLVYNNYIGLKQDGVTPRRNSSDGIDLAGGTHDNRIGGLAANQRNVIGGNEGDGIEISHDNTRNNEIVGNWIGLNTTGTAFTGNRMRGITFEDDVHNNDVHRNIIVSNGGNGVRLYTASGNDVYENFIGVYPPGMNTATVVPTPTTAMLATLINGANNTQNNVSYGKSGVYVMGGSQNNVLRRNVISNALEYGVEIDAERGYLAIGSCQTYYNTITENWIYNNTLAGIRLRASGDCTPNTYTGNEGLAAPTITAANTTQVTGTTCASCVVEVFLADKSALNDPDNAGEGKVFLGRATANAAGAFTVNVSSSALTAGNLVTATATNPAGSTSAFARNVAVTQGENPPPPIEDFPFVIQLPLITR